MSTRAEPLLFVMALVVGAALGVTASGPGHAAPEAAHRTSVTDGLDCSACHTPESWKGVASSTGQSGFDHSRTGFPLTQRHREVPCTGCHRSDRNVTRQCAGCHEDAHAGQLGAACDGCHSAASWSNTASFARHRQTRLPLTGMHALVECRDCHARTDDRAFTTIAADCYACHADDYRRPDLHPLHVGVPGDPAQPPFPRDCTQCHRTSGWLPVFVDTSVIDIGMAGMSLTSLRAHDRLFPISQGPHRTTDCGTCHTSPGTPRAVRCNGCHAHNEVALRNEHRRVGAFGANCLSCHPGGRVR